MGIELREQRDKSGVVKAARKAKKESAHSKTIQMRQNAGDSTFRSTPESSPTSRQTTTLPVVDEAGGLWEQMAALVVGSDGIGELDAGGGCGYNPATGETLITRELIQLDQLGLDLGLL